MLHVKYLNFYKFILSFNFSDLIFVIHIFSLANFFSKTSRSKNGPRDKQFNGIENEWLYNYSKEVNKNNKFDFFIYGHRHLPLKITFDASVYFNLGEWVSQNTYLEISEAEVKLLTFDSLASPKGSPIDASYGHKL